MALRLYNTLSREKEVFRPVREEEVGLYTCGPTVYHYAHIGNLRSFIFSDVLKRVLEYNDYQVKHVMNITDVGHLTSDDDEGEDKLEKGARREGKTAWEIAEFYTEEFKKDLQRLNVTAPDVWCRATEHIEEQIELVRKIEEKGCTYKTSDGIYFDTSKLEDYGKLVNLEEEGLEEGSRVEMKEKKNKTDFALWKFSPEDKERAMEWDSPWGVGFPGWHVECSAMSSKYLGEQFDIHTGGQDLAPVHHTNEIAQSETAFGKKPWVKYWLHGEFLILKEGKMSKSEGKFLTLKSLKKKGFQGLHYRYLCLTAHYRQQLKFSSQALEGAKNSYEKLKNRIVELKNKKAEEKGSKKKEKEYRKKFLEAVNNDLNMPSALSILWEVLRDDSLSSSQKVETALDFDRVLGLGIEEMEEEKVEVSEEVQKLVEKREKARSKKDWEKADRLREKIEKKGYVVKDSKEGTKIEEKKFVKK